MLELLKSIDDFAWGPPLLILLVGTGIYLTMRLGLLQVLRLPKAFQLIFIQDKGHGDVSSFAALCTALASTVGTGNIIGVATAIKVGGPGALFWMWMAAFFGMATKYAEGLLAIKYRTKDDHGAVAGGPMHYILLGMGEKWRPLAVLFAVAGVLVALLGIGTFTQVNSITESIQNTTTISPVITALVLSVFVAIAVFGGLKSISKVSTTVVPFMTIIYILGTLIVIFFNIGKIPGTIALVFTSAFSTVFSHFGPALLTIFLVLFAFTTILGWNYYGERCFEFLFGVRFIWLYRVVFVLMVLLGGFIELDMVWIIADIVNALMALPNLIALLVLSQVVIAETKKYFDK
ncbi:Na+/alanine symporter [Streptococcus pneumoniae]|nr:Na+/alanine symporter [Streptococcus pneumoniae]VOA51046.1 Na+/alanine symporter [Streptococcus pneumoniae]VOK90918.1 Na+/alanine symporter [Streptococcus pneumoniae]HET2102548.1 sodium:alanine symporter family protein [Streptococcus pneumoniae]